MLEAIRVLEARIEELIEERGEKIRAYHEGQPKQELGYGITMSKEASDAYSEAARLAHKIADYRAAILDLKKARGWHIDGVVDRKSLIAWMEKEGWVQVSKGSAGELWSKKWNEAGVIVLYNLEPDTFEWRGVLERVTGNLRLN